MSIPTDLKYALTDEWVRVEGNIATIGVSDYAQDSLSDIVFFEAVVATGDAVTAKDHIATLESVKAAADIISPVTGKVVAVNDDLGAAPETVNSDPYGAGWMLKIEMTSQSDLDHLMDAAGYEKYLSERGHLMFFPNSPDDRAEMLRAIGLASAEDLFIDIPEKYRFPKLKLPPALSEMEALDNLNGLAQANASTRDLVCFLGAGAYNHYVPAAVDAIIQRGEFLTAYTPYQPEVSQGTLQSIFEYQSLVSALTGMDISNASHYDGATACAEAVGMAYHHFRGKRNKVVLSQAVNPQYRETIRTYTQAYEDLRIVGDESSKDPLSEPDDLTPLIDLNTAVVIVQYPDFFGRVFDYTDLASLAHQNGALLCVAVNPTALGLFKPPADFGADIVVGEGQPLGIPLSLGGPYLGIFAVRKEFARKISGRLVGETIDSEGKRGYVLTLTAREQHIRREKATSNICTNQGLIALASTVYLSLLGKHGLRRVAELCYQKSHYAAAKIAAIPGYSICLPAQYFHEFVVCCPRPVHEINNRLLDLGMIGGYDLGNEYPGLENHMLIAVTEMISKTDIDNLCDALEEISHD